MKVIAIVEIFFRSFKTYTAKMVCKHNKCIEDGG